MLRRVRADSANVIPPSFRRLLHRLCCSCVLHWQLESGWLSSNSSGPVLPVADKSAAHTNSHHLQIHWEQMMSIFGKIISAIFGTTAAATPAGGSAPATGGNAGPAGTPLPTPAPPGQSVDVAAILDKAVAAQKEKLEWRTSIVDLMKALDIDSSFAARAANGGKLPPDIKH
jgi:hypothetical protein